MVLTRHNIEVESTRLKYVGILWNCFAPRLLNLKALVGSLWAANTDSSKPNFVFILTDDQGFSDVSWKNRQVRTPNLDILRQSGLTIEGGYSQSRCTPTRMSLMTGRYPWNFGFDADGVIETTGAAGIPTSETLLPEYLKQIGYDTHFYGKWHLGYCDDQLRPENRGFDTSFGFMGAGINYSSHTTSGATKYADYWNQGTFETSSAYTTDDFVDKANIMLDQRISSSDSGCVEFRQSE